MSLYAVLPPRNFASFENQFLLECYNQSAKHLTNACLALCLFCPISHVNEEKLKKNDISKDHPIS